MATFRVTLTNASTNYHLLDLIRAQDANFRDFGREISVFSDDGNGASVVRLGESSALSDTVYGYKLAAGEGRVYEERRYVGGLYARSSGAGANLQIDIVR